METRHKKQKKQRHKNTKKCKEQGKKHKQRQKLRRKNTYNVDNDDWTHSSRSMELRLLLMTVSVSCCKKLKTPNLKIQSKKKKGNIKSKLLFNLRMKCKLNPYKAIMI